MRRKPVALTVRERLAAKLAGEGKTYVDIGGAMGVGYETAKTYILRARCKLKLGDKAALAEWARENLKEETSCLG